MNYETYADDFGKLYRKAYKTMQTRQNRAYDVNDYYTKYTQPWQEDVKQKMEYYRKNNDLNGFKEYLDKAKKQYKP